MSSATRKTLVKKNLNLIKLRIYASLDLGWAGVPMLAPAQRMINQATSIRKYASDVCTNTFSRLYQETCDATVDGGYMGISPNLPAKIIVSELVHHSGMPSMVYTYDGRM